MPRQRDRRRVEREASANLGDDYKHTNDPALAAQRAEGRRRRKERASQDRVAWVRCMIRGCKESLAHRHGDAVQVCYSHAIDIWESVERADEHPFLREVMAAEIERRDILRAEQRLNRKVERLAEVNDPETFGDIYFVRTNGLIKVGWSSDLHKRLRAYGPQAELLAHYEARRRDEADLHRQLSPARAKGREWYEDGDILALFVRTALAEHGEPEIRFAAWTTHNGAKAKPRSWH